MAKQTIGIGTTPNDSTGDTNIVLDVYKRAAGGTETLLFSVQTEDINSTVVSLYSVSSVQPVFAIITTDRLVIKVSAQTNHTSNVTVSFVHAGTDHYSHINTPLITLHNNLAGLQGGNSTERFHLSQTELTKLGGIATGATANATDAALRDRSTHTGTQAIGTITGTVPVNQGGTNIVSYTSNNYIRAQSATVLEQRTPAQVLADIAAASSTHTHGNITNAGNVGSTANLPLITGTAGIVQAGSFGTGTNTFCQGNDSRLSDDRTGSGLRTASTVVVVSAATAPTSGQVLTATSSTVANWQTPGAGGGPAAELGTTGAAVNVNLSAPPVAGMALKATSATAATWQYLINNSASVTNQVGFAADTYLAGSFLIFPSPPVVATNYKMTFDVTKTAAGTAAPIIQVRLGTAGTTADTSRLTFTFGLGTAAVDGGMFEVLVSFRTVGSGTSAVIVGNVRLTSNLTTTGISNAVKFRTTTSSGFDSTAANLGIGASYNGGASASHTVTLVRAELLL